VRADAPRARAASSERDPGLPAAAE
jgi:hypothetical protein